jgi:LytS/YehU family sensor histidine kinase
LLVFLVLGLVEEVTVSHAGWLNERIVAVCAAGLVAGPWVGLAVGGFVTWLAVAMANDVIGYWTSHSEAQQATRLYMGAFTRLVANRTQAVQWMLRYICLNAPVI